MFIWAGWSRYKKGDLPDDMLGIHHPHGEEKNISLGTLNANTNPNFWRVQWDRNDSPTLKGSSGSPLFEDNNDRVIGWLSYGTADCDNLDGLERYGKFRKAWTGPTPEGRLRNWLDPNDFDNNQIHGRDPCFTNLHITNRTFNSAQQQYQPENKVTVQAGNTIETSGNTIINSGSEYKFSAGSQIILKPGFHARSGSDYMATIEPCDQIGRRENKNSADSQNEEHLKIQQEDSFYTDNMRKHGLHLSGEELHIWPNPTNGLFYIDLAESYVSSGELIIRKINGKVVSRHKLDGFIRPFYHLPDASGIYIIEIISNNTRYFSKILKE